MKKTHDATSCKGKDNEMSVDCDDNDDTVYIEEAVYAPIRYKISQPTYYTEPYLIGATEITPGIDRSEYELRRKNYSGKLPKESTLILASNPECKFSADGQFKYRQDATFNYFTGLQEQYTLAILTKDYVGK